MVADPYGEFRLLARTEMLFKIHLVDFCSLYYCQIYERFSFTACLEW